MEAVAQHELGRAFHEAGQWEQAEWHYRKAGRIKQERGMIGGPTGAITTWNNLAMVCENSGRPDAAEIWKTYSILAEIADRQSRPGEAAEYRRLGRESKRRFAGTAHEIKLFAPVVAMVVSAVADDTEAKSATDELVRQTNQAGGEAAEFARVVQRILAGERDPDALCQGLANFAPMVETILQALVDPSTLESLLSDPEPPA